MLISQVMSCSPKAFHPFHELEKRARLATLFASTSVCLALYKASKLRKICAFYIQHSRDGVNGQRDQGHYYHTECVIHAENQHYAKVQFLSEKAEMISLGT